MRQIVVIGARDHAAEIIAAARLSRTVVRGVYDDDSDLWGRLIADVPIKGPVNQAIHSGLPAVLAVQDSRRRQELAEQLHLTWTTVIHPRAVVERYSHVEPGCVVLDGAVVQPGVRLGEHVLIGAKATVAHDGLIGNFAHLGPGVQLAGFVQLGEGASLECGAVVIPNIKLGNWCVVGPASVVIRDVPDFARVSGVPACEVAVPAAAMPEPTLAFGRLQAG